MSQQISHVEQIRNANRLKIMADGIRRIQQQGEAPMTSQLQGVRVVGPSAKDFEIPVIEDSDYYFVAKQSGRSPFYLTPKPDYFDDYEQACRNDQVAAMQHVLSQNALTPAMLHHGLSLALAAGIVTCVYELLLKGSPVTQRGFTKVLSAPRDKQIALLDALAARGTWRPSHDIFIQSVPDVELMKWFLSHGV